MAARPVPCCSSAPEWPCRPREGREPGHASPAVPCGRFCLGARQGHQSDVAHGTAQATAFPAPVPLGLPEVCERRPLPAPSGFLRFVN